MKKIKKNLVGISIAGVSFLFNACMSCVFAETIVLKSGGVINGKIIQRAEADEYGHQIKIESDGQLFTLSLVDIQSVDGLPPEIPFWLEWKTTADTYRHEALSIIDASRLIARNVEASADTLGNAPKADGLKAQSELRALLERLNELIPPQELKSYHDAVVEACGYYQHIVEDSIAGKRKDSAVYWRKAAEAEAVSLKKVKMVYTELKIPQVYIKKIDDRIKDFEATCGLVSFAARKNYRHGISLASQGEFEGAKKEFKKAIHNGCPLPIVQPYIDLLEDVAAGKKEFYYALSLFKAEDCVIDGKFEEAIREYENALRFHSEDYWQIYEALGTLYVMVGRHEDARALFEKQGLSEYVKGLDTALKGESPEKKIPDTTARHEDGAEIIQEQEYILYIPEGIDPKQKVPFIFAMSPNADASSMINVWKPVAKRKKWIVFASKVYRNGVDVLPIFSRIKDVWKGLFAEYPIDTSRIIATGMSGGGMGAHFFSFYYPQMVSAIIVNTGMIESFFKAAKVGYPKNKIAVFLASPTDFRYREMQADKEFLENIGWEVLWLEFPGGHIIAPKSVYEEAADWVDQALQRRLPANQ